MYMNTIVTCIILPVVITGLLFAYGITNSGKTYTMSGEPNQPGILPRIMDVLFNTITDVQTPKCVCYNKLYSLCH